MKEVLLVSVGIAIGWVMKTKSDERKRMSAELERLRAQAGDK